MRVLESKQPGPQVYAMGKKKHKFRKRADVGASDSSDESNANAGCACKHINKAVNVSSLRKALKQVDIGKCTDCESGSGQRGHDRLEVSGGAVGGSGGCSEPQEDMLEDVPPSVWLCLQCGNQGCGRYSVGTHALKHFRTPHSVSHALALNPDDFTIWCYTCDDRVELGSSKRLQECVDMVKKVMGLPPRPDNHTTVKRSESFKSSVSGVTDETSTAAESKKESNRPRSLGSSQSTQSLTHTLPKVKGLNNLGNTCFFNAVMQNLSQTHILESLLLDVVKKEPLQLSAISMRAGPAADDNAGSDEDSSNSSGCSDDEDHKKITLEPLVLAIGESGKLTQSLLSFLKDMNATSRSSTLSPSALFGQVCQKAPRFKGFQQQDSHELLRHLLDGMKAEEIKRRQHSILKEFNLTENSSRKNIDDNTKRKIKAYGRQVKNTFVDSIFGGHFVSTVLCEECNIPSQIYEPFLDISLPITEEKPARPNINPVSGRGKSSSAPKPAGEEAGAAAAKDKPSKHALKKQRQEAKRKAKQGKPKLSKTKSGSVSDEAEGDNKATGHEDGAHGGIDKDIERVKSRNEEDNISRDADIEDNIESDLTRNRFHAICVETPSSRPSSIASDNQDPITGRLSELRPSSQCDSLAGDDRPTAGEWSSEDSTLKGSVGTATSSDMSSRTKVDTESSETRSLCSSETLESLNGTHSSASHRDSGVSSLENMTQSIRTINVSGDEVASVEVNSKNSSSLRDLSHVHEHAEDSGVNGQEISRSSLVIEAKLKARTSLAPRYKPMAQECSVMSCLKQFTALELLKDNNKFRCEHCTKRQGKKEGVYTNASKQLLIISPPPILTLHLKRFQQVGFGLRKVNRHVQFPMVLDLAPFCSQLCQGVGHAQHRVLYSLYGIVEHSGRLSGGHYTAYVKVRANRSQMSQPYLNTSDLSVTSTNLDRLIETMQNMALVDKDEVKVTEECEATGSESVDDLAPPGKWYYISDSRVNEVPNEANVLRCQAYLLFYERIF